MHEKLDIELTDQQYKELVQLRGGCSCHINPPCSNCSEPITKDEAEELGIDIKKDILNTNGTKESDFQTPEFIENMKKLFL